MKDKFRGYYHLSESEVNALWEKCVFVLDANVLLNLHRYPEKARNDLINAIKVVKDRLWVPHYAALEYQRNRLSVIAEQKARFGEVRGILVDMVPSLQNELSQLQLEKRHSSIKLESFVTELQSSIEKCVKALTELELQQKDVHQDDPIRDQLDKILTIGQAPKDQQELDDTLKDGDGRYSNRVPPGYLDSDKEKQKEAAFSYGGITYKRKFGDLLIWKQIIGYAKDKKKTHIVFITDDDKDDWWCRVESQGAKTIGPRPELIEEIYRLADVTHFHMYTSERFLTYAQSQLNLQISDESITQVADVRQSLGRARPRRVYSNEAVHEAVRNWAAAQYPNIEQPKGKLNVEYVARVSPTHTVGIAVVRMGEPGRTVGLKIKTTLAQLELLSGFLTQLHVVVVNEGGLGTGSADMGSRMSTYFSEIGDQTVVTIGDVVPYDEGSYQLAFLPIASFGRGGVPVDVAAFTRS